jgi:hypothetical protein
MVLRQKKNEEIDVSPARTCRFLNSATSLKEFRSTWLEITGAVDTMVSFVQGNLPYVELW